MAVLREGILEALGGDAQMEGRGAALVHVRGRFPQVGDQGAFQCRRLLEALARGTRHARVHERGQHRVVAGDAQPLQVVERTAHAFRAQPGDPHQLVGGDALVRVRVDQGLGDGQQAAAVVVRDGLPCQPIARLRHGIHPEGGGEHLHPVLLAAQKPRLLQPGDGGAHPGVVGRGIALERGVLVLAEDLAGGGDDLAGGAPLVAVARPRTRYRPRTRRAGGPAPRALLAVEAAQRLQDAVDLAPGEPGARRKAELPLHILRRVEQHAAGRGPIASGAARFLQVVLQGAGNVGVDHQPHVRLVDAHAEGVGGDDHPRAAIDEPLLDGLLDLRRQAGMEVVRGDLLVAEELGDVLASPAGRAVDDGAAGGVRRQVGRQDLMDVRELLARGRPHHDELQVGPAGAAVEDPEIDAEPVAEVGADVVLHVGLGGRGQAQHRHRRIPGPFADEARHVAVVGPEVVAPAREAMRLIQHPGADLALLQGAAHGQAAELLRRDDENARIAQTHPVQRILALGHGQQSVDGHAGADAPPFEARHLIRHERHQGRDHHGQGAGLVVAGQGRDLVAQRLAGARGQDAEHALPGHRRLDDGALHGPAVAVLRLRAEVAEAEPARELLARVVPLPAPGARGIVAGGIPQPAHQHAGFRKLVPHPGRHHRIAPGHRQPGQGVSERPAMPRRIAQDGAAMARTGRPREPLGNRRTRLGAGGPRRVPHGGEEGVEPRAARRRRGQPVPGRQQVRSLVAQRLQRLLLVAEDLQREPGVQLRVVHPPALELPVLVMLDQAVIGVAGKGEGVEPQRIHRRKPQEPEIGVRRGQMRQVEGDQVVAQQAVRADGERIQLRQRRAQRAVVKGEGLAGLRAHRSEGADAAVPAADFEIQREAAQRQASGVVHRRRSSPNVRDFNRG